MKRGRSEKTMEACIMIVVFCVSDLSISFAQGWFHSLRSARDGG